MNVLFESPRRFKVWRYSVSHRVLLLRSARDDVYSTRIDVIFGGVDRVQLNTAFEGLKIREGGEAVRAEILSRLARSIASGVGVFFIGDSESDFVLAGRPAWHEDEGTYRDPSYFESMLML